MKVPTEGRVWSGLQQTAREQGGALWQLLDPERVTPAEAAEVATMAARCECDAFLVGASLGSPARFAAVVRAVKEAVDKPVLIFPNGAAQVVPHADAILFMSLLSGRNPDYLVGEQVKGAQLVEEYRLEAISTGYLLIESGGMTTVEYVSNTRPIPRDEPELAYAHCLTAKYFGMQLVYLEAGSGARAAVPTELARRCCEAGLPLAVGGGIRNPEQAADFVRAGASFVVVGTRFEPKPDWELFKDFVSAIHTRAHVSP